MGARGVRRADVCECEVNGMLDGRAANRMVWVGMEGGWDGMAGMERMGWNEWDGMGGMDDHKQSCKCPKILVYRNYQRNGGLSG